MYAQLCKRLSEEAAHLESTQKLHSSSAISGRLSNNGNGPASINDSNISGKPRLNDNTFTRLLLHNCRLEFENRSKANEAFERHAGELSLEDEERRQNAKRKMLGNIKFIGELGKLEIISDSILHKCIQQLLDKRRGRSRGDTAEDIECLCQIMRTCGRILDTDKGAQLMEQYFRRMNILAKSTELPLRIRFMLRDVIELRRDGWVPRKAISTEGPMPINQIRNDNDDHAHPGHRGGHTGMGSVFGHGAGSGFYGRGGHAPHSGGMRGLHPNERDSNMVSSGDLFRRMGRVSFDDPLGVIPLSSPSFPIGGHPAPFSTGSPNGFGPGGPPGTPYGRQRGAQNANNSSPYYGGGQQTTPHNRHNRDNNFHAAKQQHHHHQMHNNSAQQGYNNNANKEPQGGRFAKNKILIGPPEEVSLRPSANSMTFKQPSLNAQLPLNNGGIDLFPGRISETAAMMRAAALRKQQQQQQQPATTTPIVPVKEPPASIVIKQCPREKARERKDKGPTKEEVMKKVHAMVDEQLIGHDNVSEAVQAFKDLKIPERFLRYAVLSVYSNSLERNESDRTLVADFMSQLRKDGVVSATQLHDGWKELVSSQADKESGLPCVLSHIAQITARAIVDNMLHLNDVAAITENGQHYPLFLLTLQQLHKSQGKQALIQIFNESKINLMSQLSEAEKTKERLGEILEDRDLTFLYPLLRIQGDMWRQLESDPSPASFYKWIKEKLEPSHHSDPAFINALITVLLKYITQETTFPPGANPTIVPDKALQEKELAMLNKYQRMLQTFLPTIEAQVTAVHSLQVFCLSHNFPKGMLLRWFISLYDLSIIDEDAYMRWKEDVNDAYPGKGDALFQVNAWLTWLAEQPSEEEDDDEEDKGDN